MRTTIRLTEENIARIVAEAINELSKDTYNKYWQGRADQASGKRSLSRAMSQKGSKDLAKYKSQGYPCGGAENGEEFGRMQQRTKVDQRNINHAANPDNLQMGDADYVKEAVDRVIKKYIG